MLLLKYFFSQADFFSGKKLQLPFFRDCLKERGTVQMLTVGRDAAIDVEVSFIHGSAVLQHTPLQCLKIL